MTAAHGMNSTIIATTLQSEAQRVIETLMGQVRAALAVVICTEDGFEVAAHVQNTVQVTRLSAMASSLSALGMLAGEESTLGECANVIVQAERGCIVMMQARWKDTSLILSVVSGQDATLGQILYACRLAVRSLQEVD